MANRNFIAVCARSKIIIGIAKSANCHSLSVIMDSAKNISKEILLGRKMTFALWHYSISQNFFISTFIIPMLFTVPAKSLIYCLNFQTERK